MHYCCPVCASSAVSTAGQTDLYVSLICRDCHAWSTVPTPPRPPPPAKRDKTPPS
jgi:hypothetical protein